MTKQAKKALLSGASQERGALWRSGLTWRQREVELSRQMQPSEEEEGDCIFIFFLNLRCCESKKERKVAFQVYLGELNFVRLGSCDHHYCSGEDKNPVTNI